MAELRPPPHHLPTVISVAIVAYTAATLTHEALGHGLACLALGGELEGVSTSWCQCDKTGLSAWAVRTGKAAGTGANVLLGAAALGLLTTRRDRGATAYALWFMAAVNLFLAAGYLLTDPLFGFGDWTAFVEGLDQPLLWRGGLVLTGALLAAGTMRALLPYLGPKAIRRSSGRLIGMLPWVAVGGLIMTAVATFNVAGMEFALSSGLATVGGTSFLAWFTALDWGEDSDDPGLLVEPDGRWVLTGMVALVVAGVFGRGLMFG